MMLITTLLLASVTIATPPAVPHRDANSIVIAHLDQAKRLLCQQHASSSDLRTGFLALLDAVAEASIPSAAPGGDCDARVAVARSRMSSGSMLDQAGVALLAECYRDTHGGRPFAVPVTVHSMASAREHIRRQLESAQKMLVEGRAGEAVAVLLDATMLIVTPMAR